MKKRLIIASLFTCLIVSVLAITMRTAAVAQEEPPAGTIAPEGTASDGGSESAPPEAGEEESVLVLGEEEETSDESDDETSPAPDGETAGEGDLLIENSAPMEGEEGTEAPEGMTSPEDSSIEDGASAGGEGEVTEGDEEAMETADGEGPTPEDPEELTFDFTALEDDEEAAVRNEGEETLSVDFPDEEIRSVLRIVADLFDLNLVIPQELVGRASITLHDVTWRQVFDVVLSPVGFTYIEDGNIIKVVSLESLTLEPPVTTVVILDYAQANDVLPTIEPLVNPQNGGRVQVDKRSNSLVITERPTQLRRIESIIDALDKPNVQVMIESKFVETRNRAIENIGVNWASLDGYGVSAGPFDHSYSKESVRTEESGRDSSSSSSLTQGSSPTQLTMQENRSSFDSLVDGDQTTKLTTAVFSADEFGVILSALRTNNDVKLVSNPTVVTMNNRPARIHIGEEFPIVLPRFNQQTGTYEAGEYDTVDVGIKLDVTPQVNNAGFINMEVEPDVSTLSGTITYFGAEYPVRSTRNAKSFVTVKDGFTLAIGGLVQEDTSNAETSVPVLGSIPLLGRLFSSDGKDNDQRNLIIFLTARTLSPDGMTIEEQVDPRMIHNMGLRREEIPGYRPEIEMWPGEGKIEEIDPQANPDAESDEAAGIGEPEAATDAESGVESDAESAVVEPDLESVGEDSAVEPETATTEDGLQMEEDPSPGADQESPEQTDGDIELIQTSLTDSPSDSAGGTEDGATASDAPAAAKEEAAADEAPADESTEDASAAETDADDETATEASTEEEASETESSPSEESEANQEAEPRRRSGWLMP